LPEKSSAKYRIPRANFSCLSEALPLDLYWSELYFFRIFNRFFLKQGGFNAESSGFGGDFGLGRNRHSGRGFTTELTIFATNPKDLGERPV
jgi:hypothetical protein